VSASSPILNGRTGGRRGPARRNAAAERTLTDERAHTQAWLHDHTLQMLEFIAAGAYDDTVTAERLQNLAARAADELRAYLESAGAPASSDLATALRREIADIQLIAGALTVELDCPAGVPDVSAEHVAVIAAATREALINVRKHARATRVIVTCAATRSGAEVTIADDGVGFDTRRGGAGLGLRSSVVGRMLACGGSARVVSHPGHGTLVVLSSGPAMPRPLSKDLAA
jgi:signal transduction histidine kinase